MGLTALGMAVLLPLLTRLALNALTSHQAIPNWVSAAWFVAAHESGNGSFVVKVGEEIAGAPAANTGAAPLLPLAPVGAVVVTL